jgi:hypothetical protein
MAYFNRHDICAAWNLHLQATHGGQGSAAYARLCKLQGYFKPSHNEERISGLSDNAFEIYADLAGEGEPAEHDIANPGDCPEPRGGNHRDNLYLMWAGEGYDATQVYVWANSFDDAFEHLVEYLDEHAPGRLVSHKDAMDALYRHCKEHEIDLGEISDDERGELHEIVEQENEWTTIGHTTLNTGAHIASHEWGGDDITDNLEYEKVYIASRMSVIES